MQAAYCAFCEIIARRCPSNIRYEDDEILVFDNHLNWAPVMLLVIPKQHLTQSELWGNGPLISKIASLAVSLGEQHAPNGFRILSNFGPDAEQTQPHAHVHVIGGAYLGLYVGRSGF